MWWKALLILFGTYFVIATLHYLRKKSSGSFIRSFLDLIMGGLDGVIVWQTTLMLNDLGWLDVIKDGIKWLVLCLNDYHILLLYLMAGLTTALYVYIWCKVIVPLFFWAGSNFAVVTISCVVMFSFCVLVVGESMDVTSGFLMSIVTLFVTGFISYIGIMRLISHIKYFRCPNCHTMYRSIEHYIGHTDYVTEQTGYANTDHRVEEGYREVRDIYTTETGVKSTTYRRNFTNHICNTCGYQWDTHTKNEVGSSSTPTKKETDTTTITW